jgi:hypothetical protein
MIELQFWNRLLALQERLPSRTQASRSALIVKTVGPDKSRQDPWKSISEINGDLEFYSAMNTNLDCCCAWEPLRDYLLHLSKEIIGNPADSNWIQRQIEAITTEIEKEALIDKGGNDENAICIPRRHAALHVKGIAGEPNLPRHHRTFDEICEDRMLPELLKSSKMFDDYSNRITLLDRIGMTSGSFVIPNEMPTPFINRLIQALKARKLIDQAYNLLNNLPDYDVRPENFPELGHLQEDIRRLLDERRNDRSRSSFLAADD